MFRGFDNEIVLKKAGAADAETAAYTHAVAWQQSYRGTFDEAYLKVSISWKLLETQGQVRLLWRLWLKQQRH